MKPIHVIAGVGGILILALALWYVKMTRTPIGDEGEVPRGLDYKANAPVKKVNEAKPAADAAPTAPTPAADAAPTAPAPAPVPDAAPAAPAPATP